MIDNIVIVDTRNKEYPISHSLIKTYIEFFKKIRKIDKFPEMILYIEDIRIINNTKDNLTYIRGSVDIKNGEISVIISPHEHESDDDLMQNIFHEFTHIEQYINDDFKTINHLFPSLNTLGFISFRDEIFYTQQNESYDTYLNYPWEVEARNQALIIFQEWNRLKNPFYKTYSFFKNVIKFEGT